MGHKGKYVDNAIIIERKELKVKKGENTEIYLSKTINTKDFNKFIISWNAETPEESSIEVQVQVYLKDHKTKEGKWSAWLSWGKWGTNIKRRSINSIDSLAEVSVDTLIINEGYMASKIRIKIIGDFEDKESKPILNRVVVTYLNKNNESIQYKKFNNLEVNKIIETPCISQMLREKSIAHKICSPTSITMLLNRMGENLIVEDVAAKCFDYKYNGFGNWVYNVAFAGSLGYKAYIEFGCLEVLKREIDNGYPFVASVKYTNDIENSEYPYIENSPVTTSGHLIVVCGVEKDEENEWIVVNDPAGKDNENVRLRYKLQEFMKAWESSNYVMYIIHEKVNKNKVK